MGSAGGRFLQHPLEILPGVGGGTLCHLLGGAGDDDIAAAVANPLVKLYLFVLISLPFFHAAHRLRYFLYDLGLRAGRPAVAVIMYGAAVLGTIATAYVLLTAP